MVERLPGADRGVAFAQTGSGTLHEVGRIKNPPTQAIEKKNWPAPLMVDTEHNLGITLGYVPVRPTGCAQPSFGHCLMFVMYDLATLAQLDAMDVKTVSFPAPDKIESWAVDEVRTQIYVLAKSGGEAACGVGVTATLLLFVDYTVAGGTPKFVPKSATSPLHVRTLPCAGPSTKFDAGWIHTDRESGKALLYVTGSYGYDLHRSTVYSLGVDTRDDAGQSILVRQYDLDKIFDPDPLVVASALDWQVDLRSAGCGRRNVFFVGRARNSVFTYCHDGRGTASNSLTGQQGYVVHIPLARDDDGIDRPITIDGADPVPDPLEPSGKGVANAAIRRIPALSGFARPFLDPVSGRVLLLTNDGVNGSAIWVMDPFEERFIGVMTAGEKPQNNNAKNGAGFDARNGRAYIFSPKGFIVGPVRPDPPLAGTLHRVLDQPGDLLAYPLTVGGVTPLAIAPKLRRIFVPLQGQGYVVLEDTIPDPPTGRDEDPDRLTTQTAEEADKTAVTMSGAGQASGAHTVLVGGAPRIVNGLDPACSTPMLGDPAQPSNPFNQLDGIIHGGQSGSPGFTERKLLDGQCLADQALSRGHRDFVLGSTSVDVGTSAGVGAEGQGVAFGTSDRADDRDVRNAGECYRPSAQFATAAAYDHLTQGNGDAEPLFDVAFGDGGLYDQMCSGPQEGIRNNDHGATPDPSTGVAGRDGEGFPAPRASCTETSAPTDERSVASVDGTETALFASRAECDGHLILAHATSESAGLNLPTPADAPVSVGSTSSSVISWKSPEDGTVTIAAAEAHDIQIGPLEIGTVRSVTRVSARGVAGSNHADLHRQWCDIVMAGQAIHEGCLDPSDPQIRTLVDTVNQALQRVQLSVPEASVQKTPLGYQAVVTKDRGVRAADQTVNNDDSFTVPALQVTIYNDNTEGPSRVVLQLAGVHAEARYGIVVLPAVTVPRFDRTTTVRGARSAPVDRRPPGQGVVAARPGTPATYEDVVEAIPSSSTEVAPNADERPFVQLMRRPIDALRTALEWLVNNPREFALLFVMWSILAFPIYLVVRRRSFERDLLES